MKATPGGCGIVEGGEKVEKSGRLGGSLEEKMKVKGKGKLFYSIYWGSQATSGANYNCGPTAVALPQNARGNMQPEPQRSPSSPVHR